MATYKEIQKHIKRQYGFTIKTCWIAHVKEMCGLLPRMAPNRHSSKRRLEPCPPSKVQPIKEALNHFNMI